MNWLEAINWCKENIYELGENNNTLINDDFPDYSMEGYYTIKGNIAERVCLYGKEGYAKPTDAMINSTGWRKA